MPYKHPFKLKCSYEDDKGNRIDGWKEDLPNQEVAKELFEQLIRVSNNFDYYWDPDEDGSLEEETDEI